MSFQIEQMKQVAKEVASLLKLLANENRLLILCHLLKAKCSVSELVSILGLSQSAISQHLAKLRHEKIVSYERQAQNVYYFLSDPNVKRIIQTLYELYCQKISPLEKEPFHEPEK